MSPDERKPSVFVSHNHTDSEFCRAFVDSLRRLGLDVWYDEDNQGWDKLHDEITREVESRPHFIPVLSPASVKSAWVSNEINAALALEAEGKMRTILPVVAKRCAIPVFIRNYRRIEDRDGGALNPLEASERAAIIISARDRGRVRPDTILPPDILPASLAIVYFTRRIIHDTVVFRQPLCLIQAGSVTIGSEANDPLAQENEFPNYAVDVPAFQITRFPVTVAEYACFVRDGGTAPGKGSDIDWPKQLQALDHPVVCVTWRQACDYAEWLGGVTGNPSWRLPTEVEWEKAARWEPDTGLSRVYPWGDAFDKNLCNVAESGIGTTVAVPEYLKGASPSGVRQMAGNVWEWTSSPAAPYEPSAQNHDAEAPYERIIRGGSWFDKGQTARGASRLPYDPEDYVADIGFRLVCSAPNA